jgi:hypothetical protein
MNDRMISNMKLKVLAIVAVIMMGLGVEDAFSQESNVYRIQSLFLYNFTKHVKWENEGSTFTIGIYGNTGAFNEIKDILGEKMVWGKKMNVIQLNSPEEISKCHIAYMPKSNKKKVTDFIAGTGNHNNTLLVTEDDMVGDGAAISFVYEEQKMNFKISKDKIEQAGLKVSSSLMSIGIPV